jgi:hypothetical protein
MQLPLLALLPLLHIFAVVVFLVGAVANIKKNPALGGVLALLSAFCAMAAVMFFMVLLRGA